MRTVFSVSRLARSMRLGRVGRLGRALAFVALACAALPAATPAHAERLKDLVQIQGVRDNPLIGYGLVVG
ncbi:MAG: flagellar basal body P-ring protein FlgI, partial [Paraburkholderia terricola]